MSHLLGQIFPRFSPKLQKIAFKGKQKSGGGIEKNTYNVHASLIQFIVAIVKKWWRIAARLLAVGGKHLS